MLEWVNGGGGEKGNICNNGFNNKELFKKRKRKKEKMRTSGVVPGRAHVRASSGGCRGQSMR